MFALRIARMFAKGEITRVMYLLWMNGNEKELGDPVCKSYFPENPIWYLGFIYVTYLYKPQTDQNLLIWFAFLIMTLILNLGTYLSFAECRRVFCKDCRNLRKVFKDAIVRADFFSEANIRGHVSTVMRRWASENNYKEFVRAYNIFRKFDLVSEDMNGYWTRLRVRKQREEVTV